MKTISRWLLVVIFLVIAIFINTGYADTSGVYENISWTLTDDGVLTISGNGQMPNFGWSASHPWGSNISSVIIAVQ